MMQAGTYRLIRVGFTLVELLIVISLIALLIALLLPALGAARKSSQRMQSLSNMKQMATATGAYSIDHKDRFLPRLYESGPYRSPWFHVIGKSGIYNTMAPKYRPLNEYLLADGNIPDDAEVVFAQAPLDAGDVGAESNYNNNGTSYVANVNRQEEPASGFVSLWGLAAGGADASTRISYINDDGVIETPGLDIGLVPNASEMVAYGEFGAFVHGFGYGLPTIVQDQFRWNFGPDGDYKWHVAFLDGHASLIEVKPGETWGDDFRFSWKDPPPTYVQP